MKNINFRFLTSALFLMIFSFFLVLPSLVAAEEEVTETVTPGGILSGQVRDKMKEQTDAAGGTGGFNLSLGVDDIVATVVGVALTTLGIIFLVLIIVAGYQWMTAGGNEEQIKSARKRMVNAVIGLAIVLAAWAITVFIFRRLPFTAGGSDGWSGGTDTSGTLE